MVLVSHMILQNYLIKGSCDVIGRSWAPILKTLVIIATLIVELYWF